MFVIFLSDSLFISLYFDYPVILTTELHMFEKKCIDIITTINTIVCHYRVDLEKSYHMDWLLMLVWLQVKLNDIYITNHYILTCSW